MHAHCHYCQNEAVTVCPKCGKAVCQYHKCGPHLIGCHKRSNSQGYQAYLIERRRRQDTRNGYLLPKDKSIEAKRKMRRI